VKAMEVGKELVLALDLVSETEKDLALEMSH
jgi:hypothetical protein